MVDGAPNPKSKHPLRARYQIQQQLGKNAGRKTLLATDSKNSQPVVIKLLTFDHSFEWDNLKLFEREAQTLKTLSHPCIPRYLNLFKIESSDLKQLALVQSYVPGQSLEDCIRAGRTFSESEIKELLKSLLQILVYLHGRQPPVIHRDIKPSNILLGDRAGNSIGQVYLVDFGSVQTLATQEGRTVTVVGTYGYMPPEQFGGRTVPASDLYGVGATAIALATGKHPADLPQQGLSPRFEPFVQFTPAFTSWLQQMIAPSLDRRFGSAQAALEALEKLPQWHRTYLIKHRKRTSRFYYIKNIIRRSITLGTAGGAAFGGLFGTLVLPGFFTLYGAGYGILFGLANGVIYGLLLAPITVFFFYPLRFIRLYRWTARLLGILIGTSSVLFYFFNIAAFQEEAITRSTSILLGSYFGAAIVMAGISGALIGHFLTQWYEHEQLCGAKEDE